VNVLIRIGAAVVGVALLGVAMVLYTIKPDLEAGVLDPIRTTGPIGKEITTPAFSVKATRVDVAKSLKSAGTFDDGKIVRTDGIFVIVQLQAKSNEKPFLMNLTNLETPGGFSFRTTDRTGTIGTDPKLEPLIWSKFALTFEIPKNRLAGARLTLRDLSLLPQLTSEAAVDLDISTAKAATLINGAAEGYEIPRSSP
jgi:hypothetical protein